MSITITLEMLLYGNDYFRFYVAGNYDTTVELLEILSTDRHPWIRGRVAKNLNTPNYLKCYLRYKTL